MAYRQKGFTPFTKMDPPEKANEIKSFIKNNMNNMTDKELMKKVNSMSDGKTEYNWNKETGGVESHDIDPDAPGTPGEPGYEPPVKREDLDDKGKAIWDAHRAKNKNK